MTIRHIDIIHHTHTDLGYTDAPSVARELHMRFLDAALDTCLSDPRFCWTAEATVTVDDWWRSAPQSRRYDLVRMVERGQMDVMALPFNQAPFLDARQWRAALEWLSPDARDALKPQAAMQNDVNGFPRAAAMLLLDRGISHFLTGINFDMGGSPMRRPTAFRWSMPDGRSAFVWLGDHYGTAYSYFERERWQFAPANGEPTDFPQAKAATTTLRPPYRGDMLRTDEASLRDSHAWLRERLAKLESRGYAFPRLILSYTNQWRYDNDPPFPPLADFVEAWNHLSLEPELRLTTATRAVQDMEAAVGADVPTHEGEWTDWWANGIASSPRAVAASRLAKRHLASAASPALGMSQESISSRVTAITRDLCLFDEHTWGANISVARPDSLDAVGQHVEKTVLAYRSLGQAEWLLGQLARLAAHDLGEGEYVINPAPTSFTGWVQFPVLQRERHWVEGLPAHSVQRIPAKAKTTDARPGIVLDSNGWPVSAIWQGMRAPLFREGIGDVLSVFIAPPARRSGYMQADAIARRSSTYGEAEVRETPHTLVFTQPILHESLAGGWRELEIVRSAPRATLTLELDRRPSKLPEAFYILMPFPTGSVLPRLSNGGVPFTPFTDQLPGSCRDYFAVDAWAHYATDEGNWLWASHDAPLVTIGGPHTWQRIKTQPPDPNRLWAQVFDNFWHTNFVADEHGPMRFKFEFAWRESLDDPAAAAETLLSSPIVAIQPALRPFPELTARLFRP